MYYTILNSPLGTLTALSNGNAITALWMESQRHPLPADAIRRDDLPLFRQLELWLDAYFAGADQPMDLPLAPGGTSFQKKVWQALEAIPYGETVTYGKLAAKVGCRSARAIGQAVGKNPISILIPCHRVLGAENRLTGYAGGIPNKIRLLELENIPYK